MLIFWKLRLLKAPNLTKLRKQFNSFLQKTLFQPLMVKFGRIA